jgi:16S rRNA (adenine1518-N6/adenine1519-N6)-dimethyltransferase
MDETKYFEKIAEYKMLAKHDVGQNFLLDKEACQKIVALANLAKTDRVLEIGSGAGSLSFYLAQHESESDLIDIDEGLVLKLQEDFASLKNIHPQVGNIMKWSLSDYTKIIGNLPYYITSGILEKVLLNAEKAQKAVFMVQKEVIARLRAPVGDANYGPLPILLAYRTSFEKGFNVPRTSFSPAPHVDSAVFVLNFKADSDLQKARDLYQLTGALFLHRRKTILNNLQNYLQDSEKASLILHKCGIEEKKRPENLSLADYLNVLSQLN